MFVETGVAHGGSLIFYASLCKILGKGRIVGLGTMAELSRSDDAVVRQYFHGPRGRAAHRPRPRAGRPWRSSAALPGSIRAPTVEQTPARFNVFSAATPGAQLAIASGVVIALCVGIAPVPAARACVRVAGGVAAARGHRGDDDTGGARILSEHPLNQEAN